MSVSTKLAPASNFAVFLPFGDRAGELQALTGYLASLPQNFDYAILIEPTCLEAAQSFAATFNRAFERAEDGMRLEAGLTYLLPPGREASVQNGRLHLAPTKPCDQPTSCQSCQSRSHIISLLRQGPLPEGLAFDERSVCHSMPFAVLAYDHSLRLRGYNRASKTLLGLSPSALGRSMAELAVHSFLARIEPLLTKAILGQKAVERTLVNGPQVYQVRVTPELAGAEADQRLIVTINDVTDVAAASPSSATSAQISALMDTTSVIFALKNLRGEFLYANQSFIDVFGLQGIPLAGQTDETLFGQLMASDFWSADRQALETLEPVERQHRLISANGRLTYLQANHRVLLSESGYPEALLFEASDITLEKHIAHHESLLARVFEQSGEAIVLTDATGRITRINRAFTAMTGYGEEAVGCAFSMLFAPSEPSALKLIHHLQAGENWKGELLFARADGSIFPTWFTINRMQDDQSPLRYSIASFSDITKVKAAQARSEYLSSHDSLTQLPNRSRFHDKLAEAFGTAKRRGQKLGVMFIDLDNFKFVNDSLGHAMGDHLLRLAAQRLSSVLRNGAMAARIGGDEFAVLLSDTSCEEAEALAKAILHAFSHRFVIQEKMIDVSTSIGIAIYPEEGTHDAGSLLQAADAAMYHAKAMGRSRYSIYEPSLRDKILRNNYIENELKRSELKDFLSFEFQPIRSASTDRPPFSAEALLRWNDPVLGPLKPSEFIPIAERSGQILALDRLVHEKLLRQINAWRARGFLPPRIAMNVSAYSIQDPMFATEFLSRNQEAGVPNALLCLEMTETALIVDRASVMANMTALSKAGVSIAIDDFGAGYSSLNYLAQLPVKIVKIDKSLIDGLSTSKQSQMVTRAILRLGAALQVLVVAEGVETEDQLIWLRAEDCPKVQGFLISPPVSPNEFEAMMRGGE